jgi:hypothetical protein
MKFTLHDLEIIGKCIKKIKYNDKPYPTDIRAYPEFLQYFKKLKTLDIHDIIVGAHMAYGWMPTMLKISLLIDDIDQSEFIVDAMNKVKQGYILEIDDLIKASKVINNSIIGTSKILHFINPNIYAIWDSRVCKFIYNNTYRVQDPRAFMKYLLNCDSVTKEKGFDLFHKNINDKIGYPVTAFRAIEWVAYKSQELKEYAAQQALEADGSPLSR